ncbi:serine/threonine-protein phosphatase [Solihabitans fulvus]|uniref:Serine/threonine-protein phosphatase n=1 Tax=Solihabitans fulvus TaxID=1892852 RepID=A0A5B2WJJ3_9PSEU|nr:PP2C family protein-serine/threonine phosphatase [Solihabitans fulvus]KAA2250930.1 serine/threonine-protein phosphatase [Solihabitans fulvus]
MTFRVPASSDNDGDALLADTVRRLADTLRTGDTLQQIPALAVPDLADSCTLVLPPRRGRCAWWRRGVADSARGQAGLRSLRQLPALSAALDGQLAHGAQVAGQLADNQWVLPAAFGRVSDAMMVPLLEGDRPIGALVLARRAARPVFSSPERRLVERWAETVGLAATAALVHEDQRRTIELLRAPLLPPDLPELPACTLAQLYRPAREELHIGGDFYDLHPDEAGGGALVVGDVCGNGVEAAVLAGRFRESLRGLLLGDRELVRVLRRLNEAMLDSGDSRFATLVLGELRPCPGGGLSARLAAGGHPPPLVLRAGGGMEEITIPGALVGVLPTAHFAEETVDLAPGDVLCLYTDGLFQAFGERGTPEAEAEQLFRDQLQALHGLGAEELVRRVEQLVAESLDGRDHDDITLVAVQPGGAVRTESDTREIR